MSAIQPGPCASCGLRDYPLSFGGPTICPACDCGDSGPSRMNAQRERIAELERLLSDERSRPHVSATNGMLVLTMPGVGSACFNPVGQIGEELMALLPTNAPPIASEGPK